MKIKIKKVVEYLLKNRVLVLPLLFFGVLVGLRWFDIGEILSYDPVWTVGDAIKGSLTFGVIGFLFWIGGYVHHGQRNR